MKRRKPQHALGQIKVEFAHPSRLNRTASALDGADDLGMDDQMVVDVIANITSADFEKSMPSNVNPAIWQDVYKPNVGGQELYVKFTLDDQGQLLLISFKAN